MADKKITQFSGYTGWAPEDTGVYFVVATGSPTNADSTNYKYNMTGLSRDVIKVLATGGTIDFGSSTGLFSGIKVSGDAFLERAYITGADGNWTRITGAGGGGGGGGLWSQNITDIYYNAGNVGIGTASPLTQLHIVGEDILLSGDGGNSNTQLAIYSDTDGANDAASLTLLDGGEIGNYFQLSQQRTTHSSIPSGLTFSKRVDESDTEVMRGLIGGSGQIAFAGPDSEGAISDIATGKNGHLDFFTIVNTADEFQNIFKVEDTTHPDSTPFVIDKLGSVGIGTGTADAKLHIAHTGSIGGHDVTAQSLSNAALAISKDSSPGEGWFVDENEIHQTGDNFNLYCDTVGGDYRFHLQQSHGENTPEVVIQSDGNVGIGTATPTGTLHVTGDSQFDTNVNITGDLRVSGDAYFSPATVWIGDVALKAVGDTLVVSGGGSTTDISTTGASSITGFTSGTFTDNLIVDGNVGIGTSAPVGMLHVSGGSGYIETLYITGADGNWLQITGAGGGGGSSVWSLNGLKAYYNDGNVGIGTGAPAANLHVHKASAGSSYQYLTNEHSTPVTGLLQAYEGTSFIVGSKSDHPLSLRTSGTEKMHITSSGNVGIGGTAGSYFPRAKLEISGSPFSAANKNEGIILSTINTIMGDGTFTPGIIFAPGGVGDYGASAIAGVQNGADYDRLGLAFFTHEEVSAAAPSRERMRIDSAGNVGIGTSTPLTQLHIVGEDILLSGDGGNSNTQLAIYSDTDGANDTASLTLADGGELGNYFQLAQQRTTHSSIPSGLTFSKRVDESDTEVMRGLIGGSGQIAFAGPNSEGAISDIATGKNGHLDFFTIVNTSDEFQNIFKVEDTTHPDSTPFVIAQGGNVGIGTGDPSQLLSIQGPAAAQIRIQSTSDDQAAIKLYNNSGFAQIGVSYDDGAIINLPEDTFGLKLRSENNDGSFAPVYIGHGSGPKVTISSGGYVGIGTVTPAANLHVHEASTQSAYQYFTNEHATPVTGLLQAYEGTSFIVGSSSDHPLSLKTSGTEKMHITAGGNVGIGTATPAAPLEVQSTAGGILFPRMTTTQMNAISSPTDGEMIYNTSSGKFAGYNGSWVALH